MKKSDCIALLLGTALALAAGKRGLARRTRPSRSAR